MKTAAAKTPSHYVVDVTFPGKETIVMHGTWESSIQVNRFVESLDGRGGCVAVAREVDAYFDANGCQLTGSPAKCCHERPTEPEGNKTTARVEIYNLFFHGKSRARNGWLVARVSADGRRMSTLGRWESGPTEEADEKAARAFAARWNEEAQAEDDRQFSNPHHGH